MQLSKRQRIVETTTSGRFTGVDVSMLVRTAAIAAGGFGAVYFHLSAAVSDGPTLRNAASVIASIDATLLGFLVSAGALLYAIAHTRLAQNLQRTGHFNGLVKDLFVDCSAFLIALLTAMLCLFVPEKIDEFPFLRNCVAVVLGANVTAFLLLLPLAHKFWILLTRLEPESPQELR